MNQGTARCDIYVGDQDRLAFMGLLAAVEPRFGVRVAAFAQVQNHYHLLVRSLRGELSAAMHWVGFRYAKYFNWRHGRVGTLFRGRFTSKAVEDDAYLAWLPHYIHLNPVKDGFVDAPDAWPWSSYRQVIGMESRWPWLHADELRAETTPERFRELTLSHLERLGFESSPRTADDLHRAWANSPASGNLRRRQIADIEAQVGHAFSVDPGALLDRASAPQPARVVAMAILLKNSPMTRAEIAHRYGLASAGSVTRAASRPRELMAQPDLASRVQAMGLSL